MNWIHALLQPYSVVVKRYYRWHMLVLNICLTYISRVNAVGVFRSLTSRAEQTPCRTSSPPSWSWAPFSSSLPTWWRSKRRPCTGNRQRRYNRIAMDLLKVSAVHAFVSTAPPRIDANVEDTQLNVDAAHGEILKYFQSVSSNRWMMIKIFLILIIFFIIFVVFLGWVEDMEDWEELVPRDGLGSSCRTRWSGVLGE